MITTITTRYETRPGSNVGTYRARSLGKQRSFNDQSLSSMDNHQRAAELLAEHLATLGIGTGTITHLRSLIITEVWGVES